MWRSKEDVAMHARRQRASRGRESQVSATVAPELRCLNASASTDPPGSDPRSWNRVPSMVEVPQARPAVGHEDPDYYEDREGAGALDFVRLAIGLVARGGFWVCFLFILGNAVAQSIHEKAYGVTFIELAAFPLTVLIYPFAHHPGAQAWPFMDGTSFVAAFVAMVIAYPVSTFIGGLAPVE